MSNVGLFDATRMTPTEWFLAASADGSVPIIIPARIDGEPCVFSGTVQWDHPAARIAPYSLDADVRVAIALLTCQAAHRIAQTHGIDP